jgi:thioredoxin reductase (NADPH)
MLTTEEIAAIAVFEGLGAERCERIARTAADLRLDAGDWAIHPGEQRALFAILEGRLETIQLVDGIERVVGGRGVGELVGEVPIVLGTTFPMGFRASEPTRLLQLGAQDYHALVSVEPVVAERVGALARGRIGALQGITADAPPPRALVLGERLDTACGALRRFLDRNQVTFRWVAPDAPDAEEAWGGPLPSLAGGPVVRVVDGQAVAGPTLREAARLVGLQTEPGHAEYDTVIVGGGPAGLAAAVYGASEGLRTIVVERDAPGGQAGTSSRIENYLGFPSGVSGDELASRALQQARRLGAEIVVTRAITRIDALAREVHLDGGDVLRARTIILACGVSWRALPIDGLERFVGKGVAYGAVRSEAPNVHGLDVHIVGGGNSAGQAALFFSTHARSVTLLLRGHDLGRSMSRYLVDQVRARRNVGVLHGVEVAAVDGEGVLGSLDLRAVADGSVERVASGGLFLFIGADAETGWLPPEIAVDRNGYVLTGAEVPAGAVALDRDRFLLETSVPGVFACGDVRLGPVKRVAAAVGEGSMAIAFVHQYLARDAEVVDRVR